MKQTVSIRRLPICRFAVIGTLCVVTLVGIIGGFEPWVVFCRAGMGAIAVGVVTYLSSIWFEVFFKG